MSVGTTQTTGAWYYSNSSLSYQSTDGAVLRLSYYNSATDGSMCHIIRGERGALSMDRFQQIITEAETAYRQNSAALDAELRNGTVAEPAPLDLDDQFDADGNWIRPS